jgi:hypothetical protein
MREQIKKAVSWLRRFRAVLLAFGIGLLLTSFLRLGTMSSLLAYLGISMVLLGAILLFTPKDLTPPSSHFETEPLPMDIFDLARAETYIYDHYGTHTIDYFFKLCTQLPDYLTRVDEDVRMTGRTAQSTTHLIFRWVPPKRPKRADRNKDNVENNALAVPIARVAKGGLFCDFRAFDQSGAMISTLPQWQVNGLVVAVVRNLFKRALGDGEVTIDDRFTVLRIVQIITDPRGEKAAINALMATLAQLVNGLDTRFSDESKRMIRELCESLVRSYLIVAEVDRPNGESLMVGYANTIVPVLSGRKTRIRAKHGLVPTELDVPNPLAFQAGSYHFEAFPGGDMYVYDQRMEEFGTDREAQVDKVVGDAQRWFIRKDGQGGSPAAHLYVRRQDSGAVPGNVPRLNGARSSAGDVKSVIEFREVPPGALGNAVTVALVTAIIVTFFALFRVGIEPASPLVGIGSEIPQVGTGLAKGNNNQDIPALILTLPAFLAAAVGRGMTVERLVTTSLTAFYGLWVVVGTSLVAVLLYIYSANTSLPKGLEIDIPIFAWLGHSLNILWILLALLSLAELVYLRRRKTEERRHYLRIRTSKQIRSRG